MSIFSSPLHPQSSWFSGVSFSSRGSDSASWPYRRSPLILQQRKLPLYTDAHPPRFRYSDFHYCENEPTFISPSTVSQKKTGVYDSREGLSESTGKRKQKLPMTTLVFLARGGKISKDGQASCSSCSDHQLLQAMASYYQPRRHETVALDGRQSRLSEHLHKKTVEHV